jgi:hypothetical protein
VAELPKGEDFKFYSILNFKKKDGEATREVSVNSGTFNNKEWGGWVNTFGGMIEDTLQSAWGMGFSGASMQFGFIMTPAGGCYVEYESLNCIIRRKTVIPIKHKDDKCFWFALLASYNIGNKTIKSTQVDKPIIIAKAKELCIQCDCEFNKCVNSIELPAIEEQLNTNIYILDIRDLPVI